MRNPSNYLAFVVTACLVSLTAFAQNTTTVSGSVKNSKTQEVLPAISITVKGTSYGTFTDDKGNYRLTVSQKPPFTLVISSVSFTTQEIQVNSTNQTLNVEVEPSFTVGEDVVVAASRTPERILESPVSIERVNFSTIRNAPATSYYDVIANLKGVDITTSSLNFKTISTRGFNTSGNLRLNQLVDGMDNQAPGLNFSVGNIIGLTELDVDNMELLPGASSALYGSGGVNGTLLINSKNPFKYQGLSFQVKQGINHVDNHQRKPAPFYDWSLRWGKKVSEKFAFKLGAQLMQAQDWEAEDYRNLLRNNVFSSLKGGNRQSDPNYDGVNVYGDEASAGMGAFAQAAVFQGSSQFVQAALGLPQPATQAQIQTFINAAPGNQTVLNNFLSTNASTAPFFLGLQNNVFGNQSVSRTGYEEENLVDYNTYNFKLSGGLYYKLPNNVEASLTGNWGTGTTVYTSADRYSLKNLKMGQYRLEFKGTNWFVRGYTTQENSGDSYTATTAAIAINRSWKSDQTWFGQYTGTYAGARLQGAPDAQAHAAARAAAEQGRLLPGSAGYQQAFQNALNTPISKGGARFDDNSDLYHIEGQVNLTQYVQFAEVIVGANYRNYVLNSRGTLFIDTAGAIGVNEFGGYLQVQKKLLNEVLKLTGSIRYDKNENFEGRFTPRLTALVKLAKDNNIRLSYQTAYRFPSTQDQYINLQTPGARLIGGLPEFNTLYNFSGSPAYTAESIVAYRTSGNAGDLVQAQFPTLKPESVQSFELGYKGVVAQRLLIDVYTYFSEYKDFIGRAAVGRGQSANPATAEQELISPFTTTNFSFVENSKTPVKAMGWGIGFQYQFLKGFNAIANVYGDELRDVPAGLVTFFNTPKYRYNIGLGNEDVYKGIGFNVIFKWQDKVYWEGILGTGELPSYGVLDGQLSYKLPKIKSLIKIGGTNVWNKYRRNAFGNPQFGGVYYVSFGYNVF